MRVNLKIASSSEETGALLKSYLQDRGVIVAANADIVISYGVPVPGALGNTRPATRPPGFGKIYNMEQMNNCGVRTVPWFEGQNVPDNVKFPLLARKAHGYGGKDLVPVLQRDEIAWRLAAGWDWFSEFVPIQQEFRVWVYRDEPLDVYLKVMKRPADFAYIGRNFRNGFDFQRSRLSLYSNVVQTAVSAVASLHLDWAAVDLLLGLDNNVYVLEANTAPGAIKSESQVTLGKLADRIVTWLKDGCPERG